MRWPEQRVPAQTPMMARFAMGLCDAGAIRFRTVQRKGRAVRQNQRTEEREKRFRPLRHFVSSWHLGQPQIPAGVVILTPWSNQAGKNPRKSGYGGELPVTGYVPDRFGPWVWALWVRKW